MSLSPPPPSPKKCRPLLRCGGIAVADELLIVSVEVGRSFNRTPYAIVELADRDGVLCDDGRLVPGTSVALEVATADSSESTPLFEGVLTRLGFSGGTGCEPRLRLECMDRAVATTVCGKTLARRDCPESDSAVARTEAGGLALISDAGRLVTNTPDEAGSAILSLTAGVDDFAFDVEFSGGAAAVPPVALLHGRVRLPGCAQAAPGCVSELKGLGARFSGNVLISSVRHEVSRAGWTTELGFGMPREQSAAANEMAAAAAVVADSKNWSQAGEPVRQIVFATPGGGSLVISDEATSIRLQDQNGNKVTLGADGISLESMKGIALKAPGMVRICSEQDVSVAGLNVNLAAKNGLAATGTVTAELSAAGQTAIKGAMVMIN